MSKKSGHSEDAPTEDVTSEDVETSEEATEPVWNFENGTYRSQPQEPSQPRSLSESDLAARLENAGLSQPQS